MKKKKEKKEKKEQEQEYIIPDHADYDLGADIIRVNKQKRIARRVARVAAFLIVVAVIISYLGFTLGQYFASATTMSVNTKQPEIALAQVGFKFKNNNKPLDSTDRAKYNLEPDDNIAGLYWTGGENVSKDTLSFILQYDGYASDGKLSPVTSRSFDRSENPTDITIYDGPRQIALERHNLEETLSSHSAYMDLSVYFRLIVQGDVSSQVALDNFGVYFTKDTKFTGNDDIKKSLRVGVTSDAVVDIIGPGYTLSEEIGYRTKVNVGGKLDLDGERNGAGRYGYYDYTSPIIAGESTTEERYEIAYGDFEPELTDANWGAVNSEEFEVPKDNSTYNAVTYVGVRPLINVTPKTQEFTTFSTYIRDGEKGEVIAYTDDYGIATFNLKVWIEGWDPNSSQNIATKTFGAQLKFEVYKKGLVG